MNQHCGGQCNERHVYGLHCLVWEWEWEWSCQEKMGMGTKSGYGNEIGTGMKSGEWEGMEIITLFPHTSTPELILSCSTNSLENGCHPPSCWHFNATTLQTIPTTPNRHHASNCQTFTTHNQAHSKNKHSLTFRVWRYVVTAMKPLHRLQIPQSAQ